MISLFLAQLLSLNHFLPSTSTFTFFTPPTQMCSPSSMLGFMQTHLSTVYRNLFVTALFSLALLLCTCLLQLCHDHWKNQHTEKIPNTSLGNCSNSFIQSLDFSPEGHSFSLGSLPYSTPASLAKCLWFFQAWSYRIFPQKLIFLFFPATYFCCYLKPTGSGIFCVAVATHCSYGR